MSDSKAGSAIAIFRSEPADGGVLARLLTPCTGYSSLSGLTKLWA